MFYKVSNGGTGMFKYICVFSDDTTQAKITILQISDSTITTLASGTSKDTYNYTAPDGLRISVTRNSQTDNAAKITPPSGRALKYINFKQGGISALTTLSVNTTLSTSCPVFGNVVLLGYA